MTTNNIEPHLLRAADLVPASVDDAERTVEATLSTGADVKRNDWLNGPYVERLSMSPNSIRLGRLQSGVSLLDAHNYGAGVSAVLGSVVPGSARLEKGELRARVKFSKSDAAESAFQSVKDGTLRHLSIGYVTHQYETDDRTSPPTRLVTDWEVFEASLVPVPADPNAGFRSADVAQLARRDDLAAIAGKLGLNSQFVETHVRANTPLDRFRVAAIEEAARIDRSIPTNGLNFGMDRDPRGTSYGQDALGLARSFPTYAPKLTGKEPEQGELAMRMIAAVAVGKKMGVAPENIAERYNMGDRVVRALQSSVGSSGGYLIPIELSAEIIDLLRPRTVVRKATPNSRQISIPRGNMTMGRLNTGATIGYVGEGASSAYTQEVIGDINFTARKAKAIVPVSNDLIRFAQGSADALVRDDLIRQLAVLEDAAFLRGGGTVWSPKGIRNLVASQNVIAATPSFNLSTAISDMTSLVNLLESAYVPMSNPHWFFSQRTKNFFYDARDSVGGFLFREEMDRGRFRGYPFSWTQQIVDNLGSGGNASEVYLVDMDEFMIADVPGLMIDTSQEATYSDGTNLHSAFDQDETIIRIIAEHDCNVRHTASIAILTGVTWQ